MAAVAGTVAAAAPGAAAKAPGAAAMAEPVAVAGMAVWAAAARPRRQHLPVVVARASMAAAAVAAARVLVAAAVPGAAVTKTKSDESESGVPGGKAGGPVYIASNGRLPIKPFRTASARMPLAM